MSIFKHGTIGAAALALGLGAAPAFAQHTPQNASPPNPGAERSSEESPPAPEATSERERPNARQSRSPQPRGEDTRSERRDARFASLDREQRREIQERLQRDGHYEGEIDGIYGPQTRAALRSFQEQEQLAVTGRFDASTARVMGIDAEGEVQRVSGTTQAGEQGPVREAQRALAQAGFETGPADGVMGPRTERALRDYQRANQLQVTGELDARTLRSLGLAQDAAIPQAGERPRADEPRPLREPSQRERSSAADERAPTDERPRAR